MRTNHCLHANAVSDRSQRAKDVQLKILIYIKVNEFCEINIIMQIIRSIIVCNDSR